jgi:hypothetical protein
MVWNLDDPSNQLNCIHIVKIGFFLSRISAVGYQSTDQLWFIFCWLSEYKAMPSFDQLHAGVIAQQDSEAL